MVLWEKENVPCTMSKEKPAVEHVNNLNLGRNEKDKTILWLVFRMDWLEPVNGIMAFRLDVIPNRQVYKHAYGFQWQTAF